MKNSPNILTITNLTKSFAGQEVLADQNLKVQKGEVVVIMGPNGCGKTTLLNILAGFVRPDGGEVRYAGRTENEKPGYLMQNYRASLMPWRNSWQNIGLPLKIVGKDGDTIRNEVKSISRDSGFQIDLSKFPYQLSGGQAQIVSLFRALIIGSEIVLLDEPSSNLDYKNSLKMRAFLQNNFIRYRKTFIIVTQSIEEAVQMGTRILILPRESGGEIVSIKNPLAFPRRSQDIKSKPFQAVYAQVLSAFLRQAD